MSRIFTMLYVVFACSGSIYASSYEEKNIVLMTIPKSGSQYLVQSLASGLDYKFANLYMGTLKKGGRTCKNFYSREGVVARKHNGPKNLFSTDFASYGDKLVVHVRDPRQVLLSWVHYYAAKTDNKPTTRSIPREFFVMSFDDQLNWAIDNILPKLVAWNLEWIEYIDSGIARDMGVDILVTTYEELLVNEEDLFAKILAFYDINTKHFTLPKKNKEEYRHYRKGDPNEWRETFSAEQKTRIARVVPTKLLERYNWQE